MSSKLVYSQVMILVFGRFSLSLLPSQTHCHAPFPACSFPYCFTQLQLALITCLLGHTLPPTLLATPVPTAPSFHSETLRTWMLLHVLLLCALSEPWK